MAATIQEYMSCGFTPRQAQNLIALNGGWAQALNDERKDEIWTYTSATTVTVPSNATNRYEKGDKIRFKQGGGYKYFYVRAISATLLTLDAGDDYTVDNAAITDIDRGIVENPDGFPGFFNWTPTITGSGGATISASTINIHQFSRKSKSLYLKIDFNCTVATANATAVNFTTPVAGGIAGNGIHSATAFFRATPPVETVPAEVVLAYQSGAAAVKIFRLDNSTFATGDHHITGNMWLQGF